MPLVERDRITKMRARAVVVAAGAYEQPAVFRNNDLPGIMLASAAQRLIHRYAIRPAQRVVVLAANADAYRALQAFIDAGIEVAAVIDLRDAVPADQQSVLAALRIPLHTRTLHRRGAACQRRQARRRRCALPPWIRARPAPRSPATASS